MKKKVLLFIIALSFIGCKEVIQEQKQREIEQARFSARTYADAAKRANNNDPSGFLKLYEIANDFDTYTTEYNEGATEELHYLLHSKTELWIKTFSKQDLDNIKTFIKQTGIQVIDLPKGVASDKQFEQEIFGNLKRIEGNRNEKELIAFILDTYAGKSRR